MRHRTVAIVGLLAVFIVPRQLNAQWQPCGVSLCATADFQHRPVGISGGAGGAIVAWRDRRSGTFEIYVQRVDDAGFPQWTAQGVKLCATLAQRENPVIASDGAGGAIVVWEDWRTGHTNVYAQRVDASGTPLWGDDGVSVCTDAGPQQLPSIVSDDAGGAIVAWMDGRSSADIYAQRLDASGSLQWSTDGVPLCTFPAGFQQRTRIVSDGAHGAIVAWQDTRAVNSDTYVQRVDAVGNPLWTVDGVRLCTLAGVQHAQAEIVSDGAGGAIAAWWDNRDVDIDIYAQRVDGSGALLWSPEGIAVCTVAGAQNPGKIVSDAAGGAILTWRDLRGSLSGVYAQRIDGTGASQWTPNGVEVGTAAYEQAAPVVAADGAGGAILAWDDYRNLLDRDIYAQRLGASGDRQWVPDGVGVCAAVGLQSPGVVVSDGAGGGIVAWTDSRGGLYAEIRAQRVASDGIPVPTTVQAFDSRWDRDRLAAVITWRLADVAARIDFEVSRNEAASPYQRVDGLVIERTGDEFLFVDDDVQAGRTYRYHVSILDDGNAVASFETELTTPPLGLSLGQNFPNPFNPTTRIRFTLPESGYVTLSVFDAEGRRVATLLDGKGRQGTTEAIWNGRDASGAAVASGVYFYQLTVGNRSLGRKMVLLK